MTTPNLYPAGVDPVHVQIIAATASSAERGDGSVLLLARREAIRVFLPDRAATQAARIALQRVGYQVASATGSIRNRGLLVSGWSLQGLESRLNAMRGVLERLAAEPYASASAALRQLGTLPASAMPGRYGQQELVGQADAQLRAWISATSGIHATCDPRAMPANPGCALRLAGTRRAEEAIDDLAERQVRIARFTVALYPGLRQSMSHEETRDCVLWWAGREFRLSPAIAQDTSPLLRDADQSMRLSEPRSVAPRVTSLTPRHEKAPRHRLRVGQEFPVTGRPVSPISRPPSGPSARRPGGRTFPSGRPGRRR